MALFFLSSKKRAGQGREGSQAGPCSDPISPNFGPVSPRSLKSARWSPLGAPFLGPTWASEKGGALGHLQVKGLKRHGGGRPKP